MGNALGIFGSLRSIRASASAQRSPGEAVECDIWAARVQKMMMHRTKEGFTDAKSTPPPAWMAPILARGMQYCTWIWVRADLFQTDREAEVSVPAELVPVDPDPGPEELDAEKSSWGGSNRFLILFSFLFFFPSTFFLSLFLGSPLRIDKEEQRHVRRLYLSSTYLTYGTRSRIIALWLDPMAPTLTTTSPAMIAMRTGAAVAEVSPGRCGTDEKKKVPG
ncbi:uncharacterized protein LY89DRAFT_474394 [Mollisia scopiformis]|uniref:Uncharacterized protein n=1 Tax=Mollisia scopiformis TaxID=149040 RepID=A0A194XJB6_MOLSC|nr:uncharacterized protein LY89DRAFT_474394 [Mollisia scopiformis]KUJ20214.1 hypothetical protein LY89DRAFT_474394 [Mollisia scopiformis]